MELEEINGYIRLASVLGLVVALYSYYVKIKFFNSGGKYRALCDFNENMSCTRVLASSYGKGFGIVGKLFGENSSMNISNSILGSIFYATQLISTFYNQSSPLVQTFAFSSSVMSILGSIYLAYILYFVLKDFCLVCNLSYLVNIALFYLNWSLFFSF